MLSFCSRCFFIVNFDKLKSSRKFMKEGTSFKCNFVLLFKPWFHEFTPTLIFIAPNPVYVRMLNLPSSFGRRQSFKELDMPWGIHKYSLLTIFPNGVKDVN